MKKKNKASLWEDEKANVMNVMRKKNSNKSQPANWDTIKQKPD